MAQRAGRLTCPRCGANNFDTVTVCWKCGAALQAGASATMAPMTSGMPPQAMERAPMASPSAYAPAAASGDPAVAKRAAIALALVFPWIGLPVGWIFMMIEDHRRQAVGRVCAVWSAIALFFHLLLMFVAAESVGGILQMVLGKAADVTTQSGNRAGGGSTGGDTGLGGFGNR
jgi:hypothetical protein